MISQVLVLALLAPLLTHGAQVEAAESPHQEQAQASALRQALALGLAYVAAAKTPWPEDGRDDIVMAQEDAAQARRLRIEHEIQQNPDHPWAGVYRYGDGLGLNISLWVSPQAGAVYTWRGCLGLYDVNHGEIERVDSSGLHLSLATDPKHNWRLYSLGLPRPVMAKDWFFVNWGDESFLIPSAQMIPFCNAVNSSDGYALRQFPIRNGVQGRGPDLALPPGLPAVPSPYRPFLLSAPVNGLLSAVEAPVLIGTYVGGSPSKYQISATLDVGLQAGLLPGMILYTLAEKPMEAEVIASAERESTIEFRYPEGSPNLPLPGMRLSTSPR